MYEYYFTFRTMLPAQQAAVYLNTNGINGKFARSPYAMAKNGCGYAVVVRERDSKNAAFLLKAGNYSYEKVLKSDPAGVIREVFL